MNRTRVSPSSIQRPQVNRLGSGTGVWPISTYLPRCGPQFTRVGPYFVSTIFLGLDHQWGNGPPILFETMVFVENPHTVELLGKEITLNSDFLDIQERCSTWLEAEAQHQRVIDEIKQPSDSIEEIEATPSPAQS